MITVGLDFGTHQTKICVEQKEGIELEYTFFKFLDTHNLSQYTLPSIIGIGNDGLLSYGYLPDNYDGRIIKYFKQKIYHSITNDDYQIENMYYAIWYLAFIFFDLEEKYDVFALQMGVPTDSDDYHINKAKAIATIIAVSAFKLVEDVFNKDKQKFLSTPITELESLTEIVTYSDDIKTDYAILVFPEAYVCLKPLVNQGKLTKGMSLMVDIGGGTTDISFFTIEKKQPQVYDFYSINKGLNYLTCAEDDNKKGIDVNVLNDSEIDPERKRVYFAEINQVCSTLRAKLEREFRKQTNLNILKLTNALRNRPLVYSGGGSTFSTLRVGYSGFVDKKQVSEKEWETKDIDDINDIISKGLCPILSTAYGLAISMETDDIETKPFYDIFLGIRGAEDDEDEKNAGRKASYSYKDDWMNKDYSAIPSTIRSSTRKSKNKHTSGIYTSQTYPMPSRPTKKPASSENKEKLFYNLPIEHIDRSGLSRIHETSFTLTDDTELAIKYYGEAKILDGNLYDLYYDNNGFLIIDRIRIVSRQKIERRTIVVVNSASPLYGVLKQHGIDCIYSIAGAKNNPNASDLKLYIRVSNDEYTPDELYTYKLVSKTFYKLFS